MTLKTKLLGAGAALLLSASAAAALPAVAQTDLTVRSGPGTQYPVVGSIPAGKTVEAGSCTRNWCQVSFSGGSGYVNRRYLAMAGAVPSVGVAVAPAYTYDDYAYADDYYDNGYTYGPGIGVVVGSRFHNRHHGWGGNRWSGNRTWDGNSVGASQGTWQGHSGGNRLSGATPGSVSPPTTGNVSSGFRGAGPQVSAPVGLRGGGSATGGIRGGAAAPSAGIAAPHMGGGGPGGAVPRR